MKKPFLVIATLLLLACSKKDDSNSAANSNCGSHNGKQLFLGPEDGCYYMNSNGNKTYVERSECKCN